MSAPALHPFDAQLMQIGDNLGDFPGNRPYGTVQANGWDPDGYLFKSTYATKALLDECEQRGCIAGVWFDVHPRSSEDPVRLANDYSAACTQLGIVAGNLRPVLFDWEKIAGDARGSLDWQERFCARWDVLRYGRPTIYSVEPNQDPGQNAYVPMTLRNAATQSRLRKVSTQTYFGGMQPLNVKACIHFLLDRCGLPVPYVNATIDPRMPPGGIACQSSYGVSGVVVFDAERTSPA